MASRGREPPRAEPPAEIEPRLFLIRLEDGKGGYVICERVATIEPPTDQKDGLHALAYRQVEELYRHSLGLTKPHNAIGIPAEIDPRGGGYVLFGSSMGRSSDK